MNLIEEAVVIELFGIRMYAFGVYVALGVLCAMIVLAVCGRIMNMKAGTAALSACLGTVCGFIFSRIVFCLLNQELDSLTPLSVWPQVSGGGWSMFGLIIGAYFGGWISARIMKEKPGKISDAMSIALLPLIAAERIGESRISDFDVSRPLDSQLLAGSFLSVGEDEPVLATYYIAAAVAVVLFIVLAFRLSRKEKEGILTNAFFLLFGAATIITESLRYDFFLSITFVGLQQVAAAMMLALGIILALRRSRGIKTATGICAVISLPVMVGIIIGLEFALDRTTWNKFLIYAGMIITVGIPAALGMILLKKGNDSRESDF